MVVSDKILGLLPYELASKCTIGDLPGTNENAICIMEYSGYSNTEYFKFSDTSTDTIFQPIVKVAVRNFSYETASEYVKEIKYVLHRYHDDEIMSILMIGSPIYLGRSNQKLHEFQVSFSIRIKE